MKKCFQLIFFLLFCAAFSLQAQQSGHKNKSRHLKVENTIKGSIVDAESLLPLEFASIALYNKLDSSVISGSLSNTDGTFNIVINKNQVFAKIEYISYESIIIDPIVFENNTVDLGQIQMMPSGEYLEEIEIVGEKSENRFALDKRIFTVGKDLANKGGTAEDILDNVPSVTVDIEGNVSLRGSQGVRILIDGRPSGLAGVENANGLRNISANVIEQVEVITNPSARYEAEGMAGIINIVLKKNKSDGFNGSFDLTGGYPFRTGIAANLNYREEKFNWFFNYGLRYNENPGSGYRAQDQTIDSPDSVDPDRQLNFQNQDRNRTGLSNSFRFGADYFFNDKEQITATFMFRKSDEDNFSTINYSDYIGDPNVFQSDYLWLTDVTNLTKGDYQLFESQIPIETLSSQVRRTENEIEDEKNLEYSLNYEKQFSSRKHKLTGNIQFREKSEIESSDFINTELFNQSSSEDFSQQSNNDESEKTWLIQLDYVHPLGEDHKFELGLRSSLRNIKNDFIVEDLIDNIWTPAEGLSNNFRYDENIHAAYSIYGNTIKRFGFQVGLRTEYSFINTQLIQSEIGGTNERNYLNLFPSGHLNYNFTDKSAIQISYSRRVRRPRFWDLNPFFTFSDNRNFFSGNPNVNPEFTDSYELGQLQYWDDLTLSGSIFYRHTTGSIQRVLTVDNSTTNTLRMPLNIGIVDDFGIDVSTSYSGIKWLRLDANINIFRNQLTLNQSETQNEVFRYYQSVRNFAGTIEEFEGLYDYSFNETDNITWNGRLTARLSFWDSDFQIRSNYRGPRETSQGSSRSILTVDVGWSKDLLKKKMTINIGVRDLFNNRRRRGYNKLDEFFLYSEFQWRSRSANLTLSYRINQKKKFNKDMRGESGFDQGEF